MNDDDRKSEHKTRSESCRRNSDDHGETQTDHKHTGETVTTTVRRKHITVSKAKAFGMVQRMQTHESILYRLCSNMQSLKELYKRRCVLFAKTLATNSRRRPLTPMLGGGAQTCNHSRNIS